MTAIKNALKSLIVRLHRRLLHIVDNPYQRLHGHYGEGVILNRDCSFVAIEGIHIGNWVYIGPGARMSGSGGLWIGNNIAIGPDVSILTSNHRTAGVSHLPFGPELDLRPVKIEDHVWIGAGVIILPGVTVHEGAIVGAGSVVTQDVERCAIVGGNPARVLKWRDTAEFDRLREQNRFWIRELARATFPDSTGMDSGSASGN